MKYLNIERIYTNEPRVVIRDTRTGEVVGVSVGEVEEFVAEVKAAANNRTPQEMADTIADAISFIESFDGEPDAFDSDSTTMGLARYEDLVEGLRASIEYLEEQS